MGMLVRGNRSCADRSRVDWRSIRVDLNMYVKGWLALFVLITFTVYAKKQVSRKYLFAVTSTALQQFLSDMLLGGASGVVWHLLGSKHAKARLRSRVACSLKATLTLCRSERYRVAS